jgi:hypothetical protein
MVIVHEKEISESCSTCKSTVRHLIEAIKFKPMFLIGRPSPMMAIKLHF